MAASQALCRGSGKQLTLRFMKSPVEVLAGELGTAAGLVLEKTVLQQEGPRQVAVSTGELETHPVIHSSYEPMQGVEDSMP